MSVRLIERGAKGKALREVAVSQKEFLIGRGADCELRLAIADVSRHHCLIRLTPDEALVEDLGSANGTYLNGQRVRSTSVLHTGDLLQIGECQLIVDLGDGRLAEMGLDTVADPAAATVRRPPK